MRGVAGEQVCARRTAGRRLAALRQFFAERADVGIGARLHELDGVGYQGFSFPQGLRGPAGPQQAKTLGELLRQHVQFADQVALPLDHAMRRVHAVERQDSAEHRVPGAGEQVMDREIVSPAGQRFPGPQPPSTSGPRDRATMAATSLSG